MAATPIETVYVNNLNDRVSLTKQREKLLSLFSKHGEIIQITLHKNLKMKGQAFITFKTPAEAERAISRVAGVKVFSKAINVTFAKSRSDAFYAKIDTANVEQISTRKRVKEEMEEKRKKAKLEALVQTDKITPVSAPKKKASARAWSNVPPNSILLLQNLPKGILQKLLEDIFAKYAGFVRVRLISARNLSFVDFEDEAFSTKCLEDVGKEGLRDQLGEDFVFSYAKR